MDTADRRPPLLGRMARPQGEPNTPSIRMPRNCRFAKTGWWSRYNHGSARWSRHAAGMCSGYHGRDASPQRPANELRMFGPKRHSIRPPFSRTARNAGSRDHGDHWMPKAKLAWRERSEGKSVPAIPSRYNPAKDGYKDQGMFRRFNARGRTVQSGSGPR